VRGDGKEYCHPASNCEDKMGSDLALTFSDIYTKVSEFLGLGSSPTGTNLALVKALTYRGYARFLMPINLRNGRLHVWSFLKQDAIIDTVGGQWLYELPENFNYISIGLDYAEDKNYPPLQATTMKRIRTLRASGSTSAYPQYWSLNTEEYTVEAGSSFALAIHPEPGQAYQLHYQYVMEPNKPTDDAHYFIGGAMVSHAILECALAMAELQEDDTKGIHEDAAKVMIQTCVEQDLRRQPRDVGIVRDGRAFYNDPVLARELRWVGAATSAYGVS
jgi:hypothetical protein